MDTCVLIPDELALVLTLHPNPDRVLQMHVALWSNTTLAPGRRFRPNEGRVRLDKLEIFSQLEKDDVSTHFFVA